MIDSPKKLKFAMPSVTSRLHRGSATILGLEQLPKEGPLTIEVPDLTLFQFRGTDIPWIVSDGLVDCGLCGLDAIIETNATVALHRQFPETTTRIALITHPNKVFPQPGEMLSLVTEYPVITSSRLKERYPDLRLKRAHGTCESFAFIEGIVGVVDLVDTGETLTK